MVREVQTCLHWQITAKHPVTVKAKKKKEIICLSEINWFPDLERTPLATSSTSVINKDKNNCGRAEILHQHRRHNSIDFSFAQGQSALQISQLISPTDTLNI